MNCHAFQFNIRRLVINRSVAQSVGVSNAFCAGSEFIKIVGFEQRDENLGELVKLGILMRHVFGLNHGRVLHEHL
jgi:hypothetical protein